MAHHSLLLQVINSTNIKTKFAKDLKSLEKLNILYRDPIKAAKFINKNYNNIVNWWKDVSNEKSFINFKKTLFFEKKRLYKFNYKRVG